MGGGGHLLGAKPDRNPSNPTGPEPGNTLAAFARRSRSCPGAVSRRTPVEGDIVGLPAEGTGRQVSGSRKM